MYSPERVFPDWPADTESLILQHLNRHDRKRLRRSWKAARKVLAKLTTRVLLTDVIKNNDTGDLGFDSSSYPLLQHLYVTPEHSKYSNPICELVEPNVSGLTGLKSLSGIRIHRSSELQCLALLTSLKRLELTASAWPGGTRVPFLDLQLQQLSSLTMLKQLRLYMSMPEEAVGTFVPQLAAGVPKLQKLDLTLDPGSEDLSPLAALTDLLDLTITAEYRDASAINGRFISSLTSMRSLTRLFLSASGPLTGDPNITQTDAVIRAASQLSSLRCLLLTGLRNDTMDLAPLAALEHLSELQLWSVGTGLGEQQVKQLTALRHLRELDVPLEQPRLLQHLPGEVLEQLEALTVACVYDIDRREVQQQLRVLQQHNAQQGLVPQPQQQQEDQQQGQQQQGQQPLVRPKGLLSIYGPMVPYFDYSRLSALDVSLIHPDEQAALHQALLGCRGITALSIDAGNMSSEALDAALLQRIARTTTLRALRLRYFTLPQPYVMACLSSGRCAELRQLTLERVEPLSTDAVAGLMALPWLQVLRLLRCEGAPEQEQCQLMLRQLQRLELLVDVVPAVAAPRCQDVSRVLSEELCEQWREGE